MAARSHLFPFRTEKLSSLSPMVLNFGRVGSRRFQESISMRLTPFFCARPRAKAGSCPPGDNRLRPSRDGVSPSATEKSSTLNPPPSTINLSFPDSCPLRRRQSVRVVRGRCVTFGDRKILNLPSSTINHPSSIFHPPSSLFIIVLISIFLSSV